jgi:hypothetical protein
MPARGALASVRVRVGTAPAGRTRVQGPEPQSEAAARFLSESAPAARLSVLAEARRRTLRI